MPIISRKIAAIPDWIVHGENGFLLESKNYEVFFANAKQIPNLLHEIGRLREITFREVGEGTNKSIDLDTYDKYYYHMFLWDREANCLAGSYRMGLGKEIYKKYGINGFYIQTLFRIEPELYQMMENTIEMGRAFIIEGYQQKPMPLFLLWKGIVHVTLRYPEHKYLMGGVSISNKFSEFSKSLMIEFMKSHYYDPYVAQYIYPKKEFKVKLKDGDKDFVFDASKADMQKFDKIIDEIESMLGLSEFAAEYMKLELELGKVYMDKGDIPISKDIFSQMVENYSKKDETAEAYYHLGHMSLMQDFNLDLAKEYFEKALSIDPEFMMSKRKIWRIEQEESGNKFEEVDIFVKQESE